MQDQAKKLSRVAGVVPAVLLTEEAGLTVGDNGAWTHLLTSPEALLQSPKGESFFCPLMSIMSMLL